MSKQHGMQMYKESDEAHLQAMEKIKQLMQTPGALEEWQESKRKEFDALPES